MTCSVDAEDAVRGRDGYQFDGQRLRCEIAKGDRGGGGGRDRFDGITYISSPFFYIQTFLKTTIIVAVTTKRQIHISVVQNKQSKQRK
jgi:hypothetical protein